MSHIAKVDLHVKNLDDLETACRALGLELVRDQQTFRNYNRRKTACEHAIRIPADRDAYEIGVVKRADGQPGYQLAWDDYRGGLGLVEKVGENCSLLKQQYALAVTQRYARQHGFSVTHQAGVNGGFVARLVKAGV